MPAAMINPAVALAMAGVGRTGPEVGNLPIKQRLGPVTSIIKQTPLPPSMPAAMINPAVALAMAGVGRTGPEVGNLPIKQRLGPVTSIIKQTPLPPSMPAPMINPAVALAMAGVGRTGPEVGNLPIKPRLGPVTSVIKQTLLPPSIPAVMINPAVALAMGVAQKMGNIPITQRLGPPVIKPARIAALSRRDPRLWRHENKNVGVLHPVEVKPAVVSRKRPSSEILVGKAKKNKHDNFDVLFGHQQVYLRQVPQIKEINAPPPPSMNDSTKAPSNMAPRNWKEVKEKNAISKKTSSKLDIANATLAEATKGKDRLEKPLPLSKSPSLDMLASVMTPALTPVSASEYSPVELFSKPNKIPGLDIPSEEDNNVIHKVDPSRSETLNHPLSFEDYKASLTKEEPPLHMSTDDDTVVEKIEEKIEICDNDDIMSQSVNESVVEVVELEEKKVPESVEVYNKVQVADQDDGDEDDVVFIAEPIVQVDVRDDDDTDDEIKEERRRRDEQVKIDFANVRVKIEPVDPDEEPIITAEETLPTTTIDTTLVTVKSSIDGNVQLDPSPVLASSLPPGGIRINISKAMRPS